MEPSRTLFEALERLVRAQLMIHRQLTKILFNVSSWTTVALWCVLWLIVPALFPENTSYWFVLVGLMTLRVGLLYLRARKVGGYFDSAAVWAIAWFMFFRADWSGLMILGAIVIAWSASRKLSLYFVWVMAPAEDVLGPGADQPATV